MPYDPPPALTQHWSVTKPAASGRRGMVVSQSRDAALAGVAILDAGGNAIDAAVATALALATVEPWNSGLGGIGFAMVHRAGQPAAETVDFGPVAPRGLKPDAFRLTGRMKQDLFAWPEVEGDANIHGPLSFAIPSAVAGYAHMPRPLGCVAALGRDRSRPRFGEARLVAGLVHHAEARQFRLRARQVSVERCNLPTGWPPPVAPYQGSPGFFRLGNLPDTLDRLAHAGLRDFYDGDVATTLAADFASVGSLLTGEDLRGCEARILPATEVDWHGRTIQLPTGLTAGPTYGRVLDLMRDAPRGEAPDAPWYAALARAMKAAYDERLTSLGEAEPKAAESCTTHLTVCDEAGTMVSVTTTLLSSMGSRVVLPQSGVLMNNGVMWFDPRPGQPNSVAPGKRPLTNMCPVIVREGDAPVLAAGASGGRRIMAAVAQMLAFTLDFGMDPATAAHHPRIDVSDPGFVNADSRLPADTLHALRMDGAVEVVEHGVLPVNFACPNLIQQLDGTRTGISDVMSPWSAAIAQA